MVFFLITISLGALRFSLPTALASQAFEKQVNRVCKKIEFAQELAIDFQTDVWLTLEQKEQGLSVHLKSSAHFPSELQSLVEQELVCDKIKSILSPEVIHFKSGLDCCPQQELLFIGKKSRRKVILPGFATPLKSYEIF